MQSRQSLELRQHHQLALTPQLQQSIRFLQLSAHELELEVSQALLENPLLERDEEYDTVAQDTVADDAQAQEDRWDTPGASSGADGSGSSDGASRSEAAVTSTLQEHLHQQLRLTRAQARDAALVSLLIEELDENGYLPTPLEDVLDCIPEALDVTANELQAALYLLQSFDPPGVGARSLSECLCLQLRQLATNPDAAPPGDVLDCALRISRDQLALLATGNISRLREALDCPLPTVRAAHALLLQLEPKPARGWATSVADYINPDVLVQRVGGRWLARINPAVMPRLRVNALYEGMLEKSPATTGLHGQLQQAYGLIKSVQQRYVTILRVAQAVVDRQQDFFEHGATAMRPLGLRDIAQELQMHESTVSRSTKQKYAQTPWGVIELKRFFGVALQTDDGEATSGAAVRELIRQLIGSEPPGKPLSDNQIALRLADQGVVIARRTVAKYREAAGIEPAILRKARAALDSV